MYRITRGLGWFSIPRGLGEPIGDPEMDGAFGTRDRRNLFRALGLREIAAGLGIPAVAPPHRSMAVGAGGWRRALDLGVLGESTRRPRAKRDSLLWAIVAVAGVTALDVFRARKLGETD